MKKFNYSLFIAVLITLNVSAKGSAPQFFGAGNKLISYVGRVDFSDPSKPRFWSPGVYIEARFEGTSLEISLNDERKWGNYNYIEVVIDNRQPVRMRLMQKENHLVVASGLPAGEHTVIICKDTESGIGYLEFTGLKCDKLLPVKKPKHKIEFIGDSITCGAGSDESEVKCDKAQWFDQHNAYMSYGARTARQLDAQYIITAVAGIGLLHSCCSMSITMPQVYDKVNLREDSMKWDFTRYTPDVVTICLGQNDGVQDSTAFCNAYLSFVNRIHNYYPKADVVCLGSPMADAELTGMLKRLLPSIAKAAYRAGNKRVYYFFFDKSYNGGCGGHPNVDQHGLIAAQFTAFLKNLENW